MSMAQTLPRFVVMRVASYPKLCLHYDQDDRAVCGEESVFSTFVKIEVEQSQKYPGKYVHLRFYYSNKYWMRDADNYVIATSTKPEEDTSKLSCTLFEPFSSGENTIGLKHVQSGRNVLIQIPTGPATVVFLSDRDNGSLLDLVDWGALVKMPEDVAFKGDNGKFLKGDWIEEYPYLQFSSEFGNDEDAHYRVYSMPDGHVRIKSVHFDKFWRLSPNWIWADSNDESMNDKDTLFWPVKIDDQTVALRSAGNNNFCERFTHEGKTNCLNAASPTIDEPGKLKVEELVLQRKIYNVRYRWEDARVFNERVLVAGTTTAINTSNQETTVAVKISSTQTKSYSFTSSLSLSLGVKTTLEASILSFTGVKFEVSAQITGAWAWGETKTETTTVEATGTVKVPPRSQATIGYVGKQGTYTIPYSYTQEDQSSTDGRIVRSEHVDGMYTGVNGYNFHFDIIDTVTL